jgi:hypothetical protein
MRVRALAGRTIEQHDSPNGGGAMSAHDGAALHIAQGTYRGTINWQMNPDQEYQDGTKVNTCSTWVVGLAPGEWAQMKDTDLIAWCQRDGSRRWLSIELAGFAPAAPTAWQIEACAQILAWCHQTYGIPLAVANHPGERGLGHHSMDREWAPYGEEWGHEACPGTGVINAKAAIVRRAQAIAAGEESIVGLEKDEEALVYNGTSVISNLALMRDTAPQRDWQGDGAGNPATPLALPLVAAVRDIKTGVAKLVDEGLPVQITVDEATEDRIATKVAGKLEPALEAIVRKIFADAGTEG